MKTLITSLFFTILFFSSCKKDNNTSTNSTKIYLISKVTFTTIPGGFTSTEIYKYDSQNRVIEYISGDTYKYTYDDNNNLLIVQTYDQSGTLANTDNYTYSANLITVKTFYGDGTVNGSYIFNLNAQQQVIALSADDQSFTYDSNGNVTSYSAKGTLTQSESYTYDNKKNPLSMIGAKNFHLMYLAQGEPTTNVNNVLIDDVNKVFTYTYNSDGFPISANMSNQYGSGSNITYEYITK